MKLSHLGLSAFHQTAITLNVTEAARQLGITQSALSQRLAALEAELNSTLFIRDPKGMILTQEGEKLLRYTEMSNQLEGELLSSFQSDQSELVGGIRIAGFSSVMRSIIIPRMMSFMRQHSKVHVDFQSYEMTDLPQVLSTSRADMIVLDFALEKVGIHQQVLGFEEYVVIESAMYHGPIDVFLDHGPHDNATESFFKAQDKRPPYRRSFMGDVYGIIQGVEEGIGRAVMSKHLIDGNKKIKVIKGFKAYRRPITLHYYERPFYSKLFQRVVQELRS